MHPVRRPSRRLSTTPRKKATAASASTPARNRDSIIEGLGVAEFDAEGRYIEADFGNLAVISLYQPSGSSGEERQQAKFRFMDVFFPHLEALMPKRPRNRHLRRLEHRPQGNRPEELEIQPEKLRLPARGARLDDAPVRRTRLGRRLPPAATRSTPARPTPGGATAARPGPRTSAGASTTRSPRPASPRRRKLPASTRTSAFPTMRR